MRGWNWSFFRVQDLYQSQFPTVVWDQRGAASALETLRCYVAAEATRAGEWYLHKRSWKRRAGQIVRLLAMLAVAVAGVLPVIAKIFGQSGQFAVDATWSTVLLGAAGLLVSLDYFFGFTSGWIRYLEAQQKIGKTLYEFQFDWEALRTSWTSGDPAPEQVHIALIRLKGMILQVQQIVEDETAAWASEFRTAVQRLDEAARAKPETVALPAGATVTVTNGAGVDAWTLAVDDGTPTVKVGSRCALVGLRPGPHKFAVEGQVDGRTARDEVSAEIRPTGVTEVTLTLK
jgi:hypothetical protein